MRCTVKRRATVALAYARRASKPSSLFGRFKFITRFRKYTRAYIALPRELGNRTSSIHPSFVSHFSWWAGSTFVRPSRVRRFFLARLKRVAAETSAIEAAWAARGSRVFIFKKGQNSRMGKGCGSFHSSRRQVVGGSLLARASSSLPFVIENIDHYVRARWGCRAVMSSQRAYGARAVVEPWGQSLGDFELRPRQRFGRRRAVWSLLRRRSMRRIASAVYGATSKSRARVGVSAGWRWWRSAFSSRRSTRRVMRPVIGC